MPIIATELKQMKKEKPKLAMNNFFTFFNQLVSIVFLFLHRVLLMSTHKICFHGEIRKISKLFLVEKKNAFSTSCLLLIELHSS